MIVRIFQLLFFIGMIISTIFEFSWYFALPVGLSGIVSFELLHRFHRK